MGEVVAFETEVLRAGPYPRPGMRRACRILAAVASILLLVTSAFVVGVLVLGLVFDGRLISLGPNAAYVGTAPDLPGVVPFGALPGLTRAAYVATLVLDFAPVVVILTALRSLLRLYAVGRLFGAANTSAVRRIAIGLLAYAVAPAVGRGLVLLAGHGVDTKWLDPSMLHAAVLAAVLLVVANVMAAGDAAEQDRAGFV